MNMTGGEAIDALREGRTVENTRTGLQYRMGCDGGLYEGRAYKGWTKLPHVPSYFIGDDTYTIVDMYPMSFVEALRAMLDDLVVENRHREGVRWRIEGGIIIGRRNDGHVELSEDDMRSGWRIA